MNIYCDESCHILNDKIPLMTLGAIISPQKSIKILSAKLRAIKDEYRCRGELKWTKVSNKNLDFYLKLVDFFFLEECLGFRALVVTDKSLLDHEQYNHGDHDSFYYKMYYYLIRNLVQNRAENDFRIYLDIKDTKSNEKVRKLRQVLGHSFYDFEYQTIKKIQQIRSHESELLQLCDFILGAITYANRGLQSSGSKQKIVNTFQEKAFHPLTQSTPPWEVKLNLFHFTPRREWQ